MVLRSRGSPVGCRSLLLVRFAATVSVLTVDTAYSAESTDGTLTKSATKTSSFNNQNILILGAGAVFRDTPN